MNIQHYVKPQIFTNPITGSTISPESSLKELSQEKSIANVKRRELDHYEKEIDKLLEPSIMEAFEKGETTFMDFWVIQKGALRFNEKEFLSNAPESDIELYKKVKELMDKPEYYKSGKPSIRYPKL